MPVKQTGQPMRHHLAESIVRWSSLSPDWGKRRRQELGRVLSAAHRAPPCPSQAMMTTSGRVLSEKMDVFRLSFYTAPVSCIALLPFVYLREVRFGGKRAIGSLRDGKTIHGNYMRRAGCCFMPTRAVDCASFTGQH